MRCTDEGNNDTTDGDSEGLYLNDVCEFTFSPEFPPLSEEVVIPILESIIEKRESPIYFALPKKWRDEQNPLVVNFLQKYNKLMNSRDIVCQRCTYVGNEHGTDCNNICRGTDERPWVNPNAGDLFGMHNLTCDSCFDTFCGECATECFHKEACVKCSRRGCKGCTESFECVGCKVSKHV